MQKINGKLFWVSLIVITYASSGCSYQYMDKDGNHRILGFGSVIVATKKNDVCSIDQVSVTSVGVSVVNLPSHGGVTIGYANNTSTQVPMLRDGDVAEKAVSTKSQGDNK